MNAPAELVLVRHAAAEPRTAEAPDEGRALTARGRRDAAALVGPLRALRPAAIWSSPYRRAVETLEPTAAALGLEVQTGWELREWDDGLPFTDDWAPHYERSWVDPSFARERGESLEELTRRAVAALRALAHQHPAERVLVGSHGTFVARALCGFGVPVRWPFPQTMLTPAIYHLRFRDPRGQPVITGPGISQSRSRPGINR
ncbi:MAG TPA: histidine phosphatase family protein [Pseudonocardia sp.]|uniref:histidine phosphatase family protein n=1 Tax=Pseudonocardia sp. TaxID=60912 RepID=UPI002B4ABC2A|nr:histidine phosphatase family protein [Pseudonocardia sp.]HLU60187.1 histidine phosphatase family protein [Pseudonocardia sp.]